MCYLINLNANYKGDSEGKSVRKQKNSNKKDG